MHFTLHELDEVASTNDVVRHFIDEGAPEGTAVCARVQRAGYGRQGRAWSSPEGGLYLSVLLRPSVPDTALATLSLAVGLAVRAATAAFTCPVSQGRIQVKWPNDVVVSCQPGESDAYRKLCGISLERHGGAVCVGIGVNVHAPNAPSPAEGRNVPVYLDDMADDAVNMPDLRDAVLAQLAAHYETWMKGGFEAVRDEYNAHALLAGREVNVVTARGDALAAGTVIDVDALGRLVLRTSEGECRAVASGEAHIAAVSPVPEHRC